MAKTPTKKKKGGKYARRVPLRKPIAFRLPADLIKLCDASAGRRRISRNKLIELTLYAAFARETVEPTQEKHDGQIDLFA